MRALKLFNIILIIRGAVRALQGEPADLGWTIASQAARRRDRQRPWTPASDRHAKRQWYPRS
jgi:hypothetical protein